MEAQLYQGLTFLAYSTGIVVILVGGMLVALLFNLSKLVWNLNDTTEIVKTELTPTLKNINKSVEILSGIVIKTDEGINKVKDFLMKSPLGKLSKLSGVMGSLGKGFISGLCTAFKCFTKKK